MKTIPMTPWIKLFCLTLALFFFFNILSPFLYSLSSSWQRFIAVQDEIGVSSGALYYTDVAVTQDAEAHVREAVSQGMAERAKKSR